MSTSQHDGDQKPTPPDKSTVILLLLTMGDTTWRMFVPIIGLLLLGILADTQLGTKPWMMISGLLIGVCLTAVLIAKQIKKVKT